MSRVLTLASGVRFDGRERDAVDADLNLGDLVTPWLRKLGFRGFHPARCVRDVREALADAGAEQLHSAARAGRFNDRRAEPRIGAGDRSGTILANG